LRHKPANLNLDNEEGRRRVGRAFLLVLLLVAAFVLARRELVPPKPLPASAPTAQFSAGRAMADDLVIARTPHPVGSKANYAVRDYLERRMAALGLAPKLQHTTVYYQRVFHGRPPAVVGGTVENLIGVLPGRDRSLPAVAVMAHYDSVPASPGAADDAAGVITALESVRALEAEGRQPARDVMLVITDGEEAGLLGANAFFQQAPQAKQVGFVINMEARGGGGRVNMFQTGAQNGGTIEFFARDTPRPQAASLSGFIYQHMPNDTDFTIALGSGLPGLNYAFLGRQFDYHSPSSTSAALDQNSVQDMGEQVLPVLRDIAFASSLPAKAPDAIYGALLGQPLIAYAAVVGWLILAVAAALVGIGAWRAWRLEEITWIDVLRGVAAALYLVLGSAAILHFARKATGVAVGYLEQRPLLAQAGRFELALVLLGAGFLVYAAAEVGRGRRTALILPLAAGLASSLFGGPDAFAGGLGAGAAVAALIGFGRPALVAGTWTGVLLTGLVLAGAAQALAPTAAPPLAWPLLLGAAGSAVSAAGARRGLIATLLVGAVALVGLTMAGVLGHLVYQGLDLPELLALPLFMAFLVALPLAQPHEDSHHGHGIGLLAIFVGLIVLAMVRWISPWTARHPQATYVAYVQDRDAGRAWRIAIAPGLDAWTRSVLQADGGQVVSRAFPPLLANPVKAAAATPVAADPPAFSLARGADGAVVLKATPPAGARVLELELRPTAEMGLLTLDGRTVPLAPKPGEWTHLRAVAIPQGVSIGFRPTGTGAIDIRWAAVSERWPTDAKPLPARTARQMPFDLSDSLVATGSQRLSW
jgi:hypothetical protein